MVLRRIVDWEKAVPRPPRKQVIHCNEQITSIDQLETMIEKRFRWMKKEKGTTSIVRTFTLRRISPPRIEIGLEDEGTITVHLQNLGIVAYNDGSWCATDYIVPVGES